MLDARRAASISPEAITLDMTFAQEGGEGATPYEVLLHAAMVGETNRFMRQDSVEETWRIMQPLLDAPRDVQGSHPGLLGPVSSNILIAVAGCWRDPWTFD
jgi:glucose-6-phosphate 1-dehydrogenase